jgi:outer membrane protein OmpA-like peptidoglycan-associated protein
MRRLALGGAVVSAWSIVVLLSAPAFGYSAKDVRDWDNAPATAASAPSPHAKCNRDDFIMGRQGVPVHPICGQLQVCLAPECQAITGNSAGGGGAPAFNGDLKLTFGTNSADLTEDDRAKLQAFASGVKDSSHRYHIDGYTDASGSVSYNVRLSRMRAESVVNYLKGLGIDAERLKAQGHGPLGGASDDVSHRLVIAHKSSV